MPHNVLFVLYNGEKMRFTCKKKIIYLKKNIFLKLSEWEQKNGTVHNPKK